jgi:hypothetical protein
MEFNLQLLFTGIGVGSIYALVALGFALIYRATNVVNFAQGDFAMLGAFAMVVMTIDLELPYWLSIVVSGRFSISPSIIRSAIAAFCPSSSAPSAHRSSSRTACLQLTGRDRRASTASLHCPASVSATCFSIPNTL